MFNFVPFFLFHSTLKTDATQKKRNFQVQKLQNLINIYHTKLPHSSDAKFYLVFKVFIYVRKYAVLKIYLFSFFTLLD